VPLSENKQTAVIDECRMTTFEGQQGPVMYCTVFYPILKRVALLDEQVFLRVFLSCLFLAGPPLCVLLLLEI